MKSAITYIGSGPKGPHVIYLAEGKRITVGRDKSTKGPAWLVVDDTPVVSAERTVPGEFDNTRAYREGWACPCLLEITPTPEIATTTAPPPETTDRVLLACHGCSAPCLLEIQGPIYDPGALRCQAGNLRVEWRRTL